MKVETQSNDVDVNVSVHWFVTYPSKENPRDRIQLKFGDEESAQLGVQKARRKVKRHGDVWVSKVTTITTKVREEINQDCFA